MINSLNGLGDTWGMVRSFSMRPKTQQICSRVDQNAGSSMDKVETQKEVDQASGQSIPSVNFDELFAAHDADGDAKLSSDEAKNAFNALRDKIQPAQKLMPAIGPTNGFTGVANAYGIRSGGELMPNPVDQNSDGSIDKSEMQALVDKLAERTGQSVSVDELFSQYDADQDEVLNADEAKQALVYVLENMKPIQMPNPVDQNSDGSIDKSEMQALVDKIAERSGQTISVDGLFSQYDADQDEVLNADEAKQALAYVLENMKPSLIPNPVDQNSDCSIDKSEMQALVDKLAERTGQTISVDDLFSQYDADQDEVLNADEAKQALSSIIKEVKPASYQTVKESNSSSINVVA